MPRLTGKIRFRTEPKRRFSREKVVLQVQVITTRMVPAGPSVDVEHHKVWEDATMETLSMLLMPKFNVTDAGASIEVMRCEPPIHDKRPSASIYIWKQDGKYRGDFKFSEESLLKSMFMVTTTGFHTNPDVLESEMRMFAERVGWDIKDVDVESRKFKSGDKVRYRIRNSVLGKVYGYDGDDVMVVTNYDLKEGVSMEYETVSEDKLVLDRDYADFLAREATSINSLGGLEDEG